MKKWILLLITFSSITTSAQNVGIGTPTPTSKFQIHSTATFGRPSLRLVDSSLDSGPILEFRNSGGANYFQLAAAVNNTDLNQSFFSIYNNGGGFPFTIRGNNSVGLGLLDPQQRLHVHNDATTGVSNAYGVFTNVSTGITATDGVAVGVNSFGNGYLMNQELNRGLFLGTQGVDRVSILANGNVGIGSGGVTERLHVNGNLNVTGLLKLNGAMGTAGQVLTSKGTANPEWEDAAYGNMTRFSTTFSSSSSSGSVSLTSQYNLSPANVTIGTNSITINKTGLYHFEGVAGTNIRFATVQTKMPVFYLILDVGGVEYHMATVKQMQHTYGTQENYGTSERFSIDLYIVAPMAIRLDQLMLYDGTSVLRTCSGWWNGNLISE